MKNTNTKSLSSGIYKIVLLQEATSQIDNITDNNSTIISFDNIDASMVVKAIAVDNQIALSQNGLRGEIEDSRKIRKMKSPFKGLPQNLDGFDYLIQFDWYDLSTANMEIFNRFRFKEVNQMLIYCQNGIILNFITRPHTRHWYVIGHKSDAKPIPMLMRFGIHFFIPD